MKLQKCGFFFYQWENHSFTSRKSRSLYFRRTQIFFFEVENFPEINAELNIPQHEEYLQKLEKAIEIIKQNNLPKLVISRPIAKEISSINLEETYQLLCKNTQIRFVICLFLMKKFGWVQLLKF